MKNFGFIVLLVALINVFNFNFGIDESHKTITFSIAAAETKPIVLRAVSAFPKASKECDPAQVVYNRFNNVFKDELKINWIGGPEAIAAFDQADALKNGVVDMILHIPYGYAQRYIPEANISSLSPYAPWEEREIGSFALWQEIFQKKLNAYLLGRLDGYAPYNIFTNKKVTKLEDFKGLTIRAYPLYIPFLKAFGMSAVTMPPSEMFTAMQQGVVDGFMWPRWGANSFGMQDVTKYRIDPGFFQGGGACVINFDVWNKIPKPLQDRMNTEIEKIEGVTVSRKLVYCMSEETVMKRSGMELIDLSKDDGEKYVKRAYDATWEVLLKQAPEYGPKFKELWEKSMDKIQPKPVSVGP